MNTSQQTVTPASPVAGPAPQSGATEVAPVPAIVVQAPPAKAAASAPVKHSRSSKAAAPVAAPKTALSVQPKASSQIVPGKIVQAGIELSPEVANMSAADRMNAFLGKKVEAPADKEQKEETESTTETVEDEETETVTAEDETEKSEETTEETEEVKDSPVAGIAKELTEKGVSPKLVKRITDLAKQNSERGEQLKRHEAKPFVVLSPGPSNPLSNVTDEAKIDEAVKATQTECRLALRKLSKMEGGGVWDEGGTNERELSADEVDAWTLHFEDLRDNAPMVGQERKAYLKSYAEVVQSLDKSASELVSPKVETRESKMVRLVPEIMRDPEYLRFLADAQAGREIREKKAKGITTIEINPKAKAKDGTVPVKASTSTTQTAKPAAQVVPTGFAAMSLDELRTKASEGNSAAKSEMARRFMTPANA